MKFHLLDHVGAPSPRFSFEATGPKSFRSAIAGFVPHDTGPAMQLRRYGDQYIRRVPPVESWHYTVVAEMPADNGRPWALFEVPERTGYFVETMVGMSGAREADQVWARIVEAVASLDEWLRQINGIARFAAEFPRPNLRLSDDN